MPIDYEDTSRLRQFLTEGFKADELRRILQDCKDLKAVVSDISESSSINKVADEAIDYCERKVCLQILHAQTSTRNPRLYQQLFGELPPAYTQRDLNTYLDHLISAFALLDLRGMSGAAQNISIPLDQVYVELQAEADNLTERDYDRRLLEQDVQELFKTQRLDELSEEERDEQIYKVLARHAYPLRLWQSRIRDAQDRPTIGGREQVALAEVVRNEPRAIFLGDPGSGKTTLLKYLALHYARALREGQQRVVVTRVRSVDNDELYTDGTKIRPPSATEVPPHLQQPLLPPRSASVPSANNELFPAFPPQPIDIPPPPSFRRNSRADEPEDLGPVRLPIFVRIPAYAEARKHKRELSLLEFLSEYWQGQQIAVNTGNLRVMFEEFLNRNAALVLLDGLDEISSIKERREIVRQIELFMTAHMRAIQPIVIDPKNTTSNSITGNLENTVSGNQVLVTSRSAGYHAVPLREAIRHYWIQDMSDATIDEFLHRWCLAVEQRQGEARSETEQQRRAREQRMALVEALKNPRIKRLAVNPLLLTLLALLNRSEGRLPRLRIELYRYATRTLIETWRDTSLTEDEVLYVLGPLALWIHTRQPTGLVTEFELRRIVTESLAKWRGEDLDDLPGNFGSEVTNFLELVRRESGLLLARGEGLYSFAHLTFQEYFVARQISRVPSDIAGYIIQHLPDPRWREALLLAVAQVAKEAGGVVGDVLDKVLSNPLPHDELLHRNLLFVASALPECAWAPPVIVRRVCRELLSIYTDSFHEHQFNPLRTQIESVYSPLRGSEAGRFAEETVCKALASSEQAQELATAHLVKNAEWYTPAVLASLVRCQPKYLANNDFISIYKTMETHYALKVPFDELPIRKSVSRNPRGWIALTTDPIMCDLLALLYAPQSSQSFKPGWAPDQITRDGPLTELITQILQEREPVSAFKAACREACMQHGPQRAWAELCLLLMGEGQTNDKDGRAALLKVVDELFSIIFSAHEESRLFLHNNIEEAAYESLRAKTYQEAVASITQAIKRIDENYSVEDLSLDVERQHILKQITDLFSSAVTLCEAALQVRRTYRQLRVARAIFRLGPLLAFRLAAEDQNQVPVNTETDVAVNLVFVEDATDSKRLTSDLVEGLVAQLRSPDDTTRLEAEDSLSKEYKVSIIGEETVLTLCQAHVEEMGHGAKDDTYRGFVATMLETVIRNLIHDQPTLLQRWIDSSTGSDEIPLVLEVILPRLSLVTPETLNLLCNTLQNTSAAVQQLLLASMYSILENADRQPWDTQLASCLTKIEATLIQIINNSSGTVLAGCINICRVHPYPSTSFVEALVHRLHNLDDTSIDILIPFATTLGRLGFKLRTSMLDIAPLLQNDKVRGLLLESRERLAVDPSFNAAQLARNLYLMLPIGPDRIARDLVNQFAKMIEDVGQIITHLENVIDGKILDPTNTAAKRKVLDSINSTLQALLQHTDHRMQTMAGEGAVWIRFPKSVELSVSDASQFIIELKEVIEDLRLVLESLLESASNMDYWSEDHEFLTYTAMTLINSDPSLISILSQRLAEFDDWPHRRSVLATFALLGEHSPSLLNTEITSDPTLETKLLEQCRALDLSCRRYALTTLSYLRRIGPDVGLILLQHCKDVYDVRTDAIKAASRFQFFDSKVLDTVIPALIGESANTCYAVTLLLAELGTSRQAIEQTEIRGLITSALATACHDPGASRKVKEESSEVQTLADTYYQALVQVVSG